MSGAKAAPVLGDFVRRAAQQRLTQTVRTRSESKEKSRPVPVGNQRDGLQKRRADFRASVGSATWNSPFLDFLSTLDAVPTEQQR